jgi:peptidoglycan/LPS O-acetylase OafA/YrhL
MKLRRITTHDRWIPEIDSLRFIAIAATLCRHTLGEIVLRTEQMFAVSVNVNELLLRAGRGVPLFFAISGFILAQPFLRQHLLHGQTVSLKAYFKRRLTRLEPPYLLSLLLYATMQAVRHSRPSTLILPLLAHIFYIQTFLPLQTLNIVTWSLEVEVQFYILAPVLGYLYTIASPVLRRGLIVTLLLSSAAFQYFSHGIASRSLPGQLQFFLVGFLLADLLCGRDETATSWWWDLLSLSAWIAMFAIPYSDSAFSLPVLIFLTFLTAFKGRASRWIFRRQWIAIPGGMCYSFYLMHMLVIKAALKVTQQFIFPSNLFLSCLIQLVLIGTCICVFCTAYFVLIERPCMDPKWPQKLMAWLPNRSRSEEMA